MTLEPTAQERILNLFSDDPSDPRYEWSLDAIRRALPDMKEGTVRSSLHRLCSARSLIRPSEALYQRNTATEEILEHNGATPNRTPVAYSLLEHPTFQKILDELPLPGFRSLLRLTIATAYVRHWQLESCQAFALAAVGTANTGKTLVFRIASYALAGTDHTILNTRSLPSIASVVGRRVVDKGSKLYTVEPPPWSRFPIVVFDEVAEGKRAALDGIAMTLDLPLHYMMENMPVELRSAVCMTWNFPRDNNDPSWTPFEKWEGSQRRLLTFNVTPWGASLRRGKAKQAARAILSLDINNIANPALWKPLPAPSLELLKSADQLLSDTFVDPANMPVSDPVLKGLVIAYGSIYGYEEEDALRMAIVDIAHVAASNPQLIKSARAVNRFADEPLELNKTKRLIESRQKRIDSRRVLWRFYAVYTLAGCLGFWGLLLHVDGNMLLVTLTLIALMLMIKSVNDLRPRAEPDKRK